MSRPAATITLMEIRASDSSFSPSVYQRVDIRTPAARRLRDVLDPDRPFDKGNEPGSTWYVDQSPRYLIRTKALQDHSLLLYRKGDAITPVSPWAFEDPRLADGEILMSKDSNVGECVVVNGTEWENHMFSGGIVRLHPVVDRLYLFAFLKHPAFKSQLLAKVPRGVTITHAKTLWMDCLIPFPHQPDADRIIRYVAAMTRAMIDKEIEIRRRDAAILGGISSELERNQRADSPFAFAHPRLDEIRRLGRLDASIYGRRYRETMHRVLAYRHGAETPTEMGMSVRPGPSLEIRLLGTRVDSLVYKPGFYRLILPTNISEYGTLNLMQYIGTRKELPLLRGGDVLIGEAGFQKGRSMVLVDPIENCTTNAHGLIARRDDMNLAESVFFRCVFNWYRSTGLVDMMAVGGSGGHLSPSYFDEFVRVPKFPPALRRHIASLYNSEGEPPSDLITLDSYVEWHRDWNTRLGLCQLDREMKSIQERLRDTQAEIMRGAPVTIPRTMCGTTESRR